MGLDAETIRFIDQRIADHETAIAKAIGVSLKTQAARPQIERQGLEVAYGTVLEVDTDQVIVALDSDTATSVPMFATGAMSVGERIAVLLTPPSAALALGGLGGVVTGGVINTDPTFTAVTDTETSSSLAIKTFVESFGGGSLSDGSDGAINFDGTNALLGLTPTGGIYTLTRDIYLANGSQVSGTAQVNTAGFRISFLGTFTVGTSAVIFNDGKAASGVTAGSVPSVQTVGQAAVGTGGNGGTAANGAAAGGVTSSIAATVLVAQTAAKGGGVGAGTGNGVTAVNTASILANVGTPHAFWQALSMRTSASNSSTSFAGGIGGNGGDAAAGGIGGGGGGGAGIVWICGPNLIIAGTVRARGGAAAAGSGSGAAGGGAGGGGGAVVLVYGSLTLTGSVTAPGGTGGGGANGGGTGATGPSGQVYSLGMGG